MRTTDLKRRLARQAKMTPAEAADQLDRVIHDILVNLRKGESATLPGLGEFLRQPTGAFQFTGERGGRGDGK